jgi:hypothetical protein
VVLIRILTLASLLNEVWACRYWCLKCPMIDFVSDFVNLVLSSFLEHEKGRKNILFGFLIVWTNYSSRQKNCSEMYLLWLLQFYDTESCII